MSQISGKFIQDLTVTLAKLAQSGAATSWTVTWTGTAWAATPANQLVSQTVTTSLTLTETQQDVLYVNSATPVNITLFPVGGRQKALRIKKTGAGEVTLLGNVIGETMDGKTSLILRNQQGVELVPNGGTWAIF